MALMKHCPGSESLRNPTLSYIECPGCHTDVEIWSDEARAACHVCGTFVFKERRPSCIDWCPSAGECFGEARYKELKGITAE